MTGGALLLDTLDFGWGDNGVHGRVHDGVDALLLLLCIVVVLAHFFFFLGFGFCCRSDAEIFHFLRRAEESFSLVVVLQDGSTTWPRSKDDDYKRRKR